MVGNNIYVTAAFRSVDKNQAMVFMEKEYVILDYAPHRSDDKILSGPDLIGNGFNSLKGTVFANQGIDCAFVPFGELSCIAYIFSGNQCAKWYYAPWTGNTRILDGPKPISEMFPFFKGTRFEKGVDAAFESTIPNEAYLFKDSEYARINYGTPKRLISTHAIGEKWPCFKNTMFEYGFDAAFPLHILNEAYVFKGENFARIQFTPNKENDKMLYFGTIKEDWNSLGSILPRHN